MKFLVVDDSPTMRRIVINALHSFGYNDVVEASDGQDALAILYTEKIDFVITDWNMPNMNGLELTKAIRNDATFGTLPVLMVTTRGIKEDIVQALQAKVNNYIVKPFTPAVLKEKIQAIVPNA
ncbi:MAG: response regulator [Ignavibacteria bacterium]|jgi:two-component system chemotaxis response regulator CheY|nr:response regulator [Ignavibacteria bacterium]MBL7993255.1 response regulator [Candidatus Kapabacteria bacterium]